MYFDPCDKLWRGLTNKTGDYNFKRFKYNQYYAFNYQSTELWH